MARISAPLFGFGDREPVKTTDDYLRNNAPGGELAMTGPSPHADGVQLPVRGDLAHIRLAGVHFVPHYAVPLTHRAGPLGATIRNAANEDADVLATLKPGSLFDVLEVAGNWAWGEVQGGHDAVGYVEMSQLVRIEP